MVYTYIINTWNPNDLYFWRSTLQNKAELPIKIRFIWVLDTYIYIYIIYMFGQMFLSSSLRITWAPRPLYRCILGMFGFPLENTPSFVDVVLDWSGWDHLSDLAQISRNGRLHILRFTFPFDDLLVKALSGRHGRYAPANWKWRPWKAVTWLFKSCRQVPFKNWKQCFMKRNIVKIPSSTKSSEWRSWPTDCS